MNAMTTATTTTDGTLDAWLAVRATLPHLAIARAPVPRATLRTTTALSALDRSIVDVDVARSVERAAGVQRAAAALATQVGRPPSVALLLSLAAHLGDGVEPALRTTPAFAKGGRERMRVFDTAEFDSAVNDAVDDAADEAAPCWLVAARLYGDVLFFHPLNDGNARLARLALVWVLARGGVAVVDLRPVITTPWSPATATALCRTVRAVCAVPDGPS
jgi:hypothetical protein